MKSKKNVLRAGSCAVTALLLASATSLTWSQTEGGAAFPNRPVRLIVPVAPGGSSDGMARVLAQRLTEAWGQQVLVDNRPGAGGVIGTQILARAAPDGHTILLTGLRFSVNPSIVLKLPYDTLNDFEPITMTASVGNVLVVPVKSTIQSVKDVIAQAKQAPGKLTFAHSGIGGAPHLIGEFFALTTGVKMTHIPYKGGGPAMIDLAGGNVSMSFASATSSLPLIKSGRLRPLAVSSSQRSPLLPDVPTLGEAGVPNIVVLDWQGILGPKGMPRPIIDKVATEIQRILKSGTDRDRLLAMGLEVIASSPDEFRREIAAEVKRWARVVKEANITAQ